jgi:hypothetical protein
MFLIEINKERERKRRGDELKTWII